MLQVVFRGHAQPGFLVHACTLGGARDVLTVVPGNKLPAEGPYACIIPVLDAWRMDRNLTERNGVPHFSTAIEPEILGHVRSGRALLVFDLTNEGPLFLPDVFKSLHNFADANNLPRSRMVWVDQNRATGPQYRAQFGGSPPDQIGFECYDFFVKVTAWFFAPASKEPVLGTDPDDYIARAFDPDRKTHLLLCLNATPRPHRILTIAALKHHGLMDTSLVSFPGLAYAKDGGVGDEARMNRYLEEFPSLEYLRSACDAVRQIKELTVDTFTEKGNALFSKIDTATYERTFFSVVTETEFTAGEVDRITEKIVKPFCLGHPTLTVGNPHATRFMTEIGFQDFDGVFDRAYEGETNPATRFNLIFDQVLKQAAAIRQSPSEWLNRVREVGSANIRHAASGKLLETYKAKYDRPVAESLARRLQETVAG